MSQSVAMVAYWKISNGNLVPSVPFSLIDYTKLSVCPGDETEAQSLTSICRRWLKVRSTTPCVVEVHHPYVYKALYPTAGQIQGPVPVLAKTIRHPVCFALYPVSVTGGGHGAKPRSTPTAGNGPMQRHAKS